MTQVKPHTQMKRIMDAYAQKKAIDANQIRFLYDGNRLQPDQTPTELEMEVHSMLPACLLAAHTDTPADPDAPLHCRTAMSSMLYW